MDFTARPHPATLPAPDVAALLAEARRLQRAAEFGPAAPLLRGKRLALLCDCDTDPDAALFRSAAVALGAQVSHIVPRLPEAATPLEMRHTARLFGRLYDAVECQGVAAERVQQLNDAAGVPVFDGLATERGALTRIAGAPGGGAVPADERRYLVQAVLLACLR